MNLKALLLTLAVVVGFATLLFIQSDTSLKEVIEKVKPDFNNDIETVQKTVFLNQTDNVEKILGKLTRVTGSIKWSTFKPEGQASHIGGVRVEISRERRYDTDTKDIVIEYLVNRQTKECGVSRIVFDGEETEVSSGLYILGFMIADR